MRSISIANLALLHREGSRQCHRLMACSTCRTLVRAHNGVGYGKGVHSGDRYRSLVASRVDAYTDRKGYRYKYEYSYSRML